MLSVCLCLLARYIGLPRPLCRVSASGQVTDSSVPTMYAEPLPSHACSEHGTPLSLIFRQGVAFHADEPFRLIENGILCCYFQYPGLLFIKYLRSTQPPAVQLHQSEHGYYLCSLLRRRNSGGSSCIKADVVQAFACARVASARVCEWCTATTGNRTSTTNPRTMKLSIVRLQTSYIKHTQHEKNVVPRWLTHVAGLPALVFFD